MKKRLVYQTVKPLFILSILLSFSGCKNDDDITIEDETCIDHFDYSSTGEAGPGNWSNYCVEAGQTNQCGSIERQSPIDIVNATTKNSLSKLLTNYNQSTTDIFNNGHTIQFNYKGDASLTFEDDNYTLLQFHFHAKSEHKVSNKQYPLEVHFVHKNEAGNLAVIGVLFEEGNENKFLAQFIDKLPKHENNTYVDKKFNYTVSDLLPANGSYFNYKGSLTTPPCSEIVEWIVMETPLTASKIQLDAFSNILHDNFRPIQSLNGRVINKYTDL